MEKPVVLLDTSILIEYFRKVKKEKSFFHRLTKEYNHFSVSAITQFEIYCGSNEHQHQFWDDLFKEIEVIPFGDEIIKEASHIYKILKKNNQLIEIPDLLIGATAKAKNMKIATINRKHFERIEGLSLIKL